MSCITSSTGLLALILAGAMPLSVLGQTGMTKLQDPQKHSGFRAFAFAPDGKTVAGGTGAEITFGNAPTRGGEIILWDAKTGKIQRRLGKPGADIDWLAYSSDSKTLASASINTGAIKIWDLVTGKVTREIIAETPIASVFLTPDAKLCVTVTAKYADDEDSLVLLNSNLAAWDLSTGKQKWSKSGVHIRAATLSSNGKSLIAHTGEVVDWKDEFKGDIRTTFDTVTYTLADSKLTVFDLATGETDKSVAVPNESPAFISTTGDRNIVAGLNKYGLKLWNMETGKVERAIAWDRRRTSFIAFVISPDGKTLGRVNEDFVELHEIATGKILGLQKFDDQNQVFTAAFAPDVKRLACWQSNPVILEITGLQTQEPRDDAKLKSKKQIGERQGRK